MRKFGVDYALLDAAHIVEDSECCLVIPAVIAREGVFRYPEGMAYKPADELRNAAWTADAAWLVKEEHPDTLILMDRKLIIGRAERPRFAKNGIKTHLRFFKSKTPRAFLKDVKKGTRKGVSIGFFYEYDATPGEFNGKHYDFVQRNILIDHVAVGVPKARCAPPLCGIGIDSAIKAAADPFADYESFEDCVAKNQDKDDPEAYCAEIKRKAEGVDQEGEGLSTAEIKQKIGDLGKRRNEIMDILYPRQELPQERKQELEGELTVIEAEIKALEEALAAKITGDQEEGEREKKEDAAKARCGKYPISFKEGKGHLTKPEEYANVDEDDFADPCNFKYPLVPDDRLMNAWSRLGVEENREKGDYSEAEWSWMKNRVEKRMEAKGHDVTAESLEKTSADEIKRAKRLLPQFRSW